MHLNSRLSSKGRTCALLVLMCMGFVASLGAEAAITCVNAQYETRVISPWKQTGVNWDVATNAPINVALFELKYRLRKTGTSTERAAVRLNWTGSGGARWYPEADAMGFMEHAGDAKGYSVKIQGVTDDNQVARPGQPARGAELVLSTPTTSVELTAQFFLFIVKARDTTTGGPFGLFSDAVAWGPEVWNGNQWVPLAGSCGVGVGGMISFDIIGNYIAGIGTPPPSPAPTVTCLVNEGRNVVYTLPSVARAMMEQVGTLPTGYREQEFDISYSCTGTGGITDPTYMMALVGQKAGSTNALASTRARVGVMVEAVDSRSGTSKIMRPDPAASAAEKVRIYDAGASGGSSLKIRAYPVRSEAGTIDAGSFSASGTLQVFTN